MRLLFQQTYQKEHCFEGKEYSCCLESGLKTSIYSIKMITRCRVDLIAIIHKPQCHLATVFLIELPAIFLYLFVLRLNFALKFFRNVLILGSVKSIGCKFEITFDIQDYRTVIFRIILGHRDLLSFLKEKLAAVFIYAHYILFKDKHIAGYYIYSFTEMSGVDIKTHRSTTKTESKEYRYDDTDDAQ